MPTERVHLGCFPTPVHKWSPPGVPEGVEMYIKRDDLSGMQMSGNKVRKLEFLMAEAKREGADCIVTIGGIQSNHCRATATAARYLGMECHLALRQAGPLVDRDPGLVGNLLVDRLVGAHIHLHTKEEYARLGSEKLGQVLADKLRAEGKRPYVIPVGGSNALGMWGYVECVREMADDIRRLGITDIAAACGSGATLGGLALGNQLAGLGCRVSSYGVCDSEDYFYDFVDDLIRGMGCKVESRGAMRCVQAKGLGYAMSKEEELATMRDVSMTTGVVMDPVYSGKALHAMLQEMRASPDEWRGRKVLFVHTGGLLGMYDKEAQLLPLMNEGRVHRLDLPQA